MSNTQIAVLEDKKYDLRWRKIGRNASLHAGVVRKLLMAGALLAGTNTRLGRKV